MAHAPQPGMKSCAVQTPWHSWTNGEMAKGCQLCVQGKKLVLFITGLCGQRCFYCPVSDHKFGSDVVYANEWKVRDPEDPVELFEEAQLTEAKGAGITGGDPLVKTDRCCAYIRLLKKRFGKGFHIHLYTPLQLVSEERLRKLHDAGLDEIRFHPDLDDPKWWPRLLLAKAPGLKWDVGIEIPAVPGYDEKTRKLIDYAVDGRKVDFINLNELELSDTTAVHYLLDKRGFKPKSVLSYGVKGSQEMALKVLEYARKKGLRAYFCTAKLKDTVQMKQRIIRRAKNVKLPFDKETKDGTLVRGVIYLAQLRPGFGYRQRIKDLDDEDKETLIEKLASLQQALMKRFKLPETSVVIDPVKYRLLVPRTFLGKNFTSLKKQKLFPAIVEEYPTRDSLEVQVEFF